MITERTKIMTLSYVIGFTAAFIAYGVADTTLEIEGEPAAVVKTSLTVLPPNTAVETETTPRTIATGVRYDEHLYALVGDEDILISADNAYGSGEGFHESVESFSLVNEGREIDFCITELPESDSCIHKTYDVESHTVSIAR